ncbi:MAG: CoA pyrophosphatase [Sphingomonadales bacterium 32-68-7]|nr:MAG: CoA pyrophosphatase [Sphingomonadales bacterium 12-68-11]OYX09833.1 MAG: CoA pyrophosphatase [Sphingomonadales bacterium 32-68-7]
MSRLFDHLSRLFDEGHGVELADLRSDAPFAPPEVRQAAVLIAVTDRANDDGGPGVILIHRPDAMRAHPGQIAFPGGKLDPGENAVAAALREAHEELAIEPGQVRIVGASDRFVTATGYDVTPVLGLVRPDLALVPNPHEVAEWFEAPLAYLLDPANHAIKETEWLGRVRPYVEIEWQGHRIWGVTAAIIANLAQRLAWRELADG